MLTSDMTQTLRIVEPIFEDNVYFIGYTHFIYRNCCAHSVFAMCLYSVFIIYRVDSVPRRKVTVNQRLKKCEFLKQVFKFLIRLTNE